MFQLLARLFRQPVESLRLADEIETLEREQSSYELAAETIDARDVISEFPPRVEHPKKKLVFDLALAHRPQGPLVIRRYREVPLPTTYRPYLPNTEVQAKKGYFRYLPNEGVDDWYLNFAHHDLFNGYGDFMFAQDEIQVAEHPALASLREMMLERTDSLRPATVENDSPTPVLLRGLPRTLDIDTRSIYGARFAGADDDVIRDGIQRIEPPTSSNIVAMEAPISSGNNIYTRTEIELALRTAYSGFRAVVLASLTDCTPPKPFVIHTGNWGCGAYGGNRQLMLSVQMMAARLAGVPKIVFYCGTDRREDVAEFDATLQRRFKFKPGASVEQVLNRLVAEAFPWGRPDGN